MKCLTRRLTVVILLCVLLSGCISCTASDKSDGSLTVTFLDVGKGDCILLRKDGSAVLIDAGYDSTADETIDFLSKAGVKSLDCFIITHYDKDHVGGAAAIAERVSVKQIYLPDYEGESEYYTQLMDVIGGKNLPAKIITEDFSFTLADVTYEIWASEIEYVPGSKKEEGNDNDVSLMVAVTWGGDSYLFAGDVEKEGISSFLDAGRGTFDVVKMPHHGRKEGNTDDFIEAVRPQIAVVTDSEDEEADNKVVKWLTEIGAAVYTSAECGRIVVKSTGVGEYEVITENE